MVLPLYITLTILYPLHSHIQFNISFISVITIIITIIYVHVSTHMWRPEEGTASLELKL